MPISSRFSILALLALVGLSVGGWAYLAPENWYSAFPGFGHSWLPVLGPYNEHLAKDVATAYLALAVLSLVAMARVRDTFVMRLVGATWLVFGALHLAYHVPHLDVYAGIDKTLNAVGLSLFVVCAGLLLPAARTRKST